MKTTRTNNIYDLAGNMWEWTTETIKRKNGDERENTFAVLRGGSFHNRGSSNSIVYRSGNGVTTYTGTYIGFRVTLYIK